MKRYILMGAPGTGKTSILRALQARGYDVIDEAATAVIEVVQAQGIAEPWRQPDFIDQIVAVQRARQIEAARRPSAVQVFDRSPVCTLALGEWLGYPASAALAAEIDRIRCEETYERRVLFVRDIGSIEPTAVRRISYADSLAFERVHVQAYESLGYELVDVPRGEVAARADVIESHIATWK